MDKEDTATNPQQFPIQRDQDKVIIDPVTKSIQMTRSPVPTRKPVEMSFYDALKEVLNGKKITRLAWETNLTFGKMNNSQLEIFINGEFHSWTIVEGDITATDWIVLPEQN